MQDSDSDLLKRCEVVSAVKEQNVLSCRDGAKAAKVPHAQLA